MSRLIGRKEVERLTSLSRSSIYARLADKASGFPRPVQLGPMRIAWIEEEIQAYIAACVAGRDAPAKLPSNGGGWGQ
jgi:prophage regulatory protein